MLNVYVDSSDDSDNELMDVLDMEHYRLQFERIFMRHRGLHENPGANHHRSLADHRCPYCDARFLFFTAHPELRFRYTSLKQQILLNLGYQLYDNTSSTNQSIAQYPLPETLKANISQVVVEMKDWLNENERYEEARGSSSLSLFRCYLREVHWIPGTVVIDRRTTARMILQAMNNFPFAGTVYRPGSCEFLLAAANCLEDHVVRYWPLLDPRVRDQWVAADVVLNNPIISYWVFKCSGNAQGVANSLERIINQSIERDNMDVLKYFWPKAVEQLNAKLAYLYDHTFHTTIDKGNRLAMYFVWYNAPATSRASMISSANCCGTRNAYNAFCTAVVRGLDDVVEFLWNNTTDEQHNGMLLADHSRAFCVASSKGYARIVDLLWSNATKNQRFVLLYEGTCAAFRDSCAEGHLNVVEILWSSADEQQRRQLLTVSQNSAFLSTCEHGRVDVLRYLFTNMDVNLKKFLIDSTLGRALNLASSKGHKEVVEFFKTYVTSLQYRRSIFSDEFAPLKSFLANAETEKPEDDEENEKNVEEGGAQKFFWTNEIRELLTSLNAKQLNFLTSKLSASTFVARFLTSSSNINVVNQENNSAESFVADVDENMDDSVTTMFFEPDDDSEDF